MFLQTYQWELQYAISKRLSDNESQATRVNKGQGQVIYQWEKREMKKDGHTVVILGEPKRVLRQMAIN
jgi:hypothetical protein